MFDERMKYKCIVLLLISFNLAAQIGEPVPCLDCEKYSKRTLPHQGLWYNVDLPGTGLTIEHQKNIVVGTFYNFDDEGNQAWYLLSGELQPSDEPNTMWTLETNLKTYKDGQCFNCEYTPAEVDNDETQINIRFHQKGSASYSIDGGEFTYIVPFIYAVGNEAPFPEVTNYRIPDLTGLWAFTFNDTLLGGLPTSLDDKYPYGVQISTLSDREINFFEDQYPGSLVAGYVISYNHRPFDDFVASGSLLCLADEIDGVRQPPECRIDRMFLDQLGFVDYTFPIGNITSNRIFGESENGETFEAIRVEFELD